MKTWASGIQNSQIRFLLRPARAAYRMARWTKACCDGTWDRQFAVVSILEENCRTAIQQLHAQQALIQQQHQEIQHQHQELIHLKTQTSDLRTALFNFQHHVESQWPIIEQRTTALEGRQHALEVGQLQWKDKTQHLENLHFDLADQVDYLKSRREIPTESYEAFQSWKKQNPPPANPLVSVCIATYNRAKLLTTRSIPSILNQSYKNLEVIVVGDCCTDDTPERIAELGDSRVRFVNLSERGNYPEDRHRRWMVAGTVPMNHALSLATGDYITHLDDDDEYLEDRIEKLVAFAQQTQADFVWHPFWRETEPETWALHEAPQFRYSQVTTSSIFYRAWFRQIPWDLQAHLLMEPGDWNRIRKIKSLGAKAERFPEPLLRHYVERNQKSNEESASAKAA